MSDYDLPAWLANKVYVVADTETLGVNAKIHRVVEIAALRVSRGRVAGAFTVLLAQPDEAFEVEGADAALVVNRLTREQVQEDGVPPPQALAALGAFLSSCDLVVGHNVQFDVGMLDAECRRYGTPRTFPPALCTQALAWGATPKCYALSLGKLCGEFGVETGQAHRAFGDVLSTAALLPAVLRRHDFRDAEEAVRKCAEWGVEVRAYFKEKGR